LKIKGESKMKKKNILVCSVQFLIVCVVMLALTASDVWSESFVYPKEGQSTEQQTKDQEACTTWAQQQTGYDPTQQPPVQTSASSQPPAEATTPTQQTSQRGSGVKGAARGAARGALIGEVSGGDAGEAAAVGAIGGAARGRSSNRRQEKQMQPAAQSQQAATQNEPHKNYLRAYKTCLEAKGYSVSTE
jgi:uncharacterized protein YcfJ